MQPIQKKSNTIRVQRNAINPQMLNFAPVQAECPVSYADDEAVMISQGTEETKAELSRNSRLELSMKFATNYLQLNSREAQEIPCDLILEAVDENSDLNTTRGRPGVDIVCAIDISGSMRGAKIDLVKRTLEFMIAKLSDNDRVSLVTFNNQSKRLCPLTAMTRHGKILLSNLVNQIQASNGTEIVEGLLTSLNILAQRRISNPVSSIVLFSDGNDNNCHSAMARTKSALIEVGSLISAGYSIHTFGYGTDHDSSLLNSMAEEKNGGFYYVEKDEFITEAFSNCLGELISVIADNVQISLQTLQTDVNLALTKIYSETGDRSFRFPPILSGDKKEAVFLLNFPPSDIQVPPNHQIQPIKATVQYRLTRTGHVIREESLLTIPVFNESQELTEIELDEDVMVNFYRVKTSEILKEAGELGDRNNMQDAREILLEGANELRRSVVSQNEVINILISDLEKAVNRFISVDAYNYGGKAEIKSKARCHWAKRGPAISSYQNCVQKAFTIESRNF